MKSTKRQSQIPDAMLGAIAGLNVLYGLFADDLSSLKGISFGTGVVIFVVLAIQSKKKN